MILLFLMALSGTPSYLEENSAVASFDVSMPIDATGFKLEGSNLTGGDLRFTDHGTYITPFLAHETGSFELPTALSLESKPLLQTTVDYAAIKLITAIGIDNFFIKIGSASRTQKVSGLDPFVIKDGTYSWKVPFFAFGKENNDAEQKNRNIQFIQVGTTIDAPGNQNAMYTQGFYLYSKSRGNTPISGHPQKTSDSNLILSKSYTTNFDCSSKGIWGSGGSDPYRSITGHCKGFSTTRPGGPNFDFEYGSITLPTVKTPWTATPNDHCVVEGKRHSGCTNSQIDSKIHYTAQKIHVFISETLSLNAAFGSVYRSITPKNLRYQCKDNVYLKNLLKPEDCLKNSYLPGGYSAPYFSVGYEVNEAGVRYMATYRYIPGQENGNRLSWRDASLTEICDINISSINGSKPSKQKIRQVLRAGLDTLREIPAVYEILGQIFFEEVLKRTL